MADKLKISKKASDQLMLLSSRLDLKRNVVCRIAIAVSVKTKTGVPSSLSSDTDGLEFNKSTILGPDELLFRSIITHTQKTPMGNDFFNIFVRNHLERGIDILHSSYSKINSPEQFMVWLTRGVESVALPIEEQFVDQ